RDLDVVVGLEAADGLAALADDHADLLGVDAQGGDARGPRRELLARLRDRLRHLPQDVVAAGLRLGEGVAHDVAGHAADLYVRLTRLDALPRAVVLKFEVPEVPLAPRAAGEDDVVGAALKRPHREPGHQARALNAGVGKRGR